MAILNGKTVLAQPRENQGARNALANYYRLTSWTEYSGADLLTEHPSLMVGLLPDARHYR